MLRVAWNSLELTTQYVTRNTKHIPTEIHYENPTH